MDTNILNFKKPVFWAAVVWHQATFVHRDQFFSERAKQG